MSVLTDSWTSNHYCAYLTVLILTDSETVHTSQCSHGLLDKQPLLCIPHSVLTDSETVHTSQCSDRLWDRAYLTVFSRTLGQATITVHTSQCSDRLWDRADLTVFWQTLRPCIPHSVLTESGTCDHYRAYLRMFWQPLGCATILPCMQRSKPQFWTILGYTISLHLVWKNINKNFLSDFYCTTI